MSRDELEQTVLQLKRDILRGVAKRRNEKISKGSLKALTLDTPYSAVVRRPLLTALPRVYLGRIVEWVKQLPRVGGLVPVLVGLGLLFLIGVASRQVFVAVTPPVTAPRLLPPGGRPGQTIVGMGEEQVTALFGPPNRRDDVAGIEVWTYSDGEVFFQGGQAFGDTIGR